MGDDTEWLKLPTDEKCAHKAWKARLAGYEEATKLFSTLDEKSPEFSKFLGLMKKMVTDSNAIAQEKALEAVLAFVENAHVAGKTSGEVCSGVVAKCLNASRAKTKERGMEILMMFIEIEKQEVVQEELIKGLTNKQPKVVAGCVQALREALRGFGSKTMPIKPLVKYIQPLLENRDKIVREEGKMLVVEMYRWCGAALKPQLANLKPVQVTELEAEFENVGSTKAVQTRFLRSQQDLKAKMEAQAVAAENGEEGSEDEDEGEVAADVDPYELMEPVDILSKIPKDFYDKIEAKKWQERREALEAVQKLVENPKLESGDYHDLVKAIKKVVAKDTNVMLVALGGKCLIGLANGLRKKFQPHACGCIDVIFDKFKEKKITVVTVLREAIDACFPATTLEAISESALTALENKNPNIKAETASFLARCFSKSTPTTLPKKLLKLFVASLLKTINDTSPEVREASFQALGTAMKVVGEKPLLPFLADVDPIKMAKIKECCEKAEVVGKKSSGSAAKSAESAPAKAAAPQKTTTKAAPPKKGPPPTGASGTEATAKPTGRPKGKPGGDKKSAKNKKGSASKEEKEENILADEVVEDKAAALLPGDVIPGLASSNWKERMAAMETFTKVIKGTPKDEIPCQVCIRTITKKPGLKETNFQVMKLKVELVSHLAQNSNFSKRSASFCLTELVDKVGDVKNGAAVQEALSCISEACGLEYASQQVVQTAFEQKNPKNQAEALNWLANAVKEFGFKVVVKPMISYIKKAFGATNPAVRTAAITLLGVLYMYMGQTLRIFFEDEKPALLQQIDAEFDKVKGEKPPTPTRGLVASEDAEEEEEEEEEAGGGGGVNVVDLVPRTDISEKITPELVTEMADKNWKIRNEGLQKVVAILNEAKFITPSIGPLPEALKARLGDSNKILVTSTINICQTLATAMGPNVKKHVPIVGPGIVACCGDSKPQIRAAAVATLTVWVDQGGIQPFVEAEIFSDELKKENPNLRIELLGWLAEKLPNVKKVTSELNLCIPYVLACMEDRNGGVRQKAQESLVPFMIHTGYDAFVKQASKLKPASKDQIMALLEKAKANVPAKPSKKTVPKTASAPAMLGKALKVAEAEPESAAPPAEVKVRGGGGGGGKARPKSAVMGGKKSPPTSSKRKKDEEEDTSPPMKVSNGKEQRFRDEKSLKVLKWNFTAPRGEFVDQLKTQMEPTFNKTLMEQLFHADFKMHIKAIEVLMKCLGNLNDETIANLDLILKWHTLRFFDTNTSVLLKGLEYLQALFNMLSAQDYHLQELEASSFTPYLINKVGDPKDQVRKNIRNICKLMCKVYPSSKMFSFVIDGLKSKNAKQRTECLEELGSLIEIYGINVCQPSPAQALKSIAQQIADRDNSVRSAALNTIVAAYHILGETVYKYVGHLNDKDQGMLEERIKRASKNRPPSTKAASPEEKPKVARVPQPQQSRNLAEINSGVPKSRIGTTNREFALDLEDSDSQTEGDIPSLIKPDLDHINEPISLPKTRVRPPSPSMKLLSGSNDAKTAIDLVISQVASNDLLTSIQALAQIDEVLKDDEKADLMSGHVDQFLVVCSLQLRMAFNKHMSDTETSKENVLRLYRCILGSLLAVFQCKNLAKEGSRDVLKDLIYNLVTILLDARLMDLEDGPQVVRTVNVMVVKIVEKSDQTLIMSALIKLLHESIASEACSQKFLELIMKCLWKMVRMLPNIINDLNLDRIIGDLHNFLRAFPSHSWKNRSSDTPLRTMKTILHSLAKLKGNKIMSHLGMIDSEHSEVEAYLQKVLKNGIDANAVTNARNNEQQMNGFDGVEMRTPKREGSSSSVKAKRLSKSTHDMLAEIFKKVGSKENTREGLNDLYDFKQKYPEADLEPFLRKASQFFQNYIERGLKNVEMERQGKLKQSSSQNTMSSSGSSGSIDAMTTSSESDMNPSVFMDRLKVLRARCGLDNGQVDVTAMSSPGTVKQIVPVEPVTMDNDPSNLNSNSSSDMLQLGSSIPTSTSNTELSAPEPVANVEDLKKRLERIKNAAKK